MLRMLLITFSLLLAYSSMLSARILIVDPGDPDQVIIGADGMGPGESATIPVYVLCDTDVGHVNIPISLDNSAVSFGGVQFFGTVLDWDDISVIERPGGTIITIAGWHDLGGPGPHPPLNTSGELELIAELYFNQLPGSPTGNYPLDITVDPNLGPMLFGDTSGSYGWLPTYQNGFVQISDEIGFTDSVFIGTDSVVAWQQAVIPVSFFNDEELEYINIPISFDTTAMFFVGGQFYEELVYWDDISFVADNISELGIVTISGQADTGGASNPYLNTEASIEVIAELYFATNSNSATGIYPLNITTDPVTGPLSIQDTSGASWAPPYENGFAIIDNPSSCDLLFEYLLALGLPSSPWEDRQNISKIINVGTETANDVVLTITIPEDFIYQSSIPPASEVNGTMTWAVGTMIPGQSFAVEWYVDIPMGMDTIWVANIGDISTSSYESNLPNNHMEFNEQMGFSLDPNDKAPVLTANLVEVEDEMYYNMKEISSITYKVEYENDSTATLPVQDITITDRLSDKLNWSTWRCEDPNLFSHPNECTATLDTSTGIAIVTLFCDDIFLPPDSGGYFEYTIFPKSNLSDGDSITNRASIVFDFNPPIEAPEDGPLKLTVDRADPISNINILEPESTYATSFNVTWSSNDGLGSGVKKHDIYVSEDGGPFTLWLDSVSGTSATYTGEGGKSYTFYSIATDYVRNVEGIPPDSADATIYIMPIGDSYIVGDVNGFGGYNGMDIVYGLEHFKDAYDPLKFPVCDNICPDTTSFWICGDVNGSCSYNGLDITYGVAFFKGGDPPPPAPVPCPACPPE